MYVRLEKVRKHQPYFFYIIHSTFYGGQFTDGNYCSTWTPSTLEMGDCIGPEITQMTISLCKVGCKFLDKIILKVS